MKKTSLVSSFYGSLLIVDYGISALPTTFMCFALENST